MNYKGNAFSAGAGAVSDAVFRDGRIYFLQNKGAFDLRAFDREKNAFLSVEKSVSFADKCWFFGGGLLELFSARLSFSQDGGSVVAKLS